MHNTADLFSLAEQYDCQALHMHQDPKTGVHAFIALHHTPDYPALGGCRLYAYPSVEASVLDAMRLAQGMGYKSAIVGLPFRGGKCVLIKPAEIPDRVAYFSALGKFIDSLHGAYISGMDSGTTVADMDVMAQYTRHVVSTSHQQAIGGDPAPYTAKGVYLAALATVKSNLMRDSLSGLTILIQGVGAVGYQFAKLCHANGVNLLVSDVNETNVQRCVKDLGAKAVAPEAIFQTPCDIFSPCALGAILNPDSILQLQAQMVVGSANNQLESVSDGPLLQARGIIWAPDYVANAGGLVHAAREYLRFSAEEEISKIEGIYETTLEILERAKAQRRPTNEIADTLARERMDAGTRT